MDDEYPLQEIKFFGIPEIETKEIDEILERFVKLRLGLFGDKKLPAREKLKLQQALAKHKTAYQSLGEDLAKDFSRIVHESNLRLEDAWRRKLQQDKENLEKYEKLVNLKRFEDFEEFIGSELERLAEQLTIIENSHSEKDIELSNNFALKELELKRKIESFEEQVTFSEDAALRARAQLKLSWERKAGRTKTIQEAWRDTVLNEGWDPIRTLDDVNYDRVIERAGARCESHFKNGDRCRYDGPHVEVDHIVPHTGGGWTLFENSQLLCHNCNQRKGARIPGPTWLRGIEQNRKSYVDQDKFTLKIRHIPTFDEIQSRIYYIENPYILKVPEWFSEKFYDEETWTPWIVNTAKWNQSKSR